MERIDRFMTIWAIVMVVMVVIVLPTAIILAGNAQIAKRAEAAKTIEKPKASFNPIEVDPPEQRETHFTSSLDRFYRFFEGGKYYYDAPKHTYQVAQTITGVLLGTENATENFKVNYITDYGMARICQHGEYWHVAGCCNPNAQR